MNIKRRVLIEDSILAVRVPKSGLIVEVPTQSARPTCNPPQPTCNPASEYRAEALREAEGFESLSR
jgi:hypothetical protein